MMIQYTKAYIQSLLDKYMEGMTTLEEEDILSQYFTRGDVPEEWEDYRQLFAEIEGMKPRKSRKRWIGWSAAAAVVGAVFIAATMSQHTEQTATGPSAGLTAKADTILRPEAPNEQPLPDTTALEKLKPAPKHRRLRKPEPTIHDYDKAYALMAQAAKEQQQAEQEMEQAQQEILHAQLTAAGYIAIRQEDGTIIYTNEPNEYFAYEE